jgi:Uma2 family endonuclease
MGFAHKILPQYTYEDYLLWEGRWELIDGIPYAMAPMPVPEHQWIATNLAAEFRGALKKAGCSCKVYQPLDYKLADDTIFNPDLLVVCQPITKKYLDFAPNLVVEILSESTALKDRHIKYPRYEAEGIPYYLIVDTDIRSVEVYHLVNGKYQRQSVVSDKPFPFQLDTCRFEVSLHQIWE